MINVTDSVASPGASVVNRSYIICNSFPTIFQVVIDTIPSMMNALRMVWIISRHYNRDERMVPLMERIAWELAERVARVIQVRILYK